MRYNDQELFNISDESLEHYKETMSFNFFCDWAIVRLSYLVEQSTTLPNWMDTDVTHLRTYRMKAVKFYEQKRGKHEVTH